MEMNVNKREKEALINLLVESAQRSTDYEEKSERVEILLKLLKPFRFSLGKKFGNKGIEFEDICQQIDLIIIEAIADYDSSKDPSSLRHITSRARNGIWNYYRKEMYYFDESKKTISLEFYCGDGDEESTSYAKYDDTLSYDFNDEEIVERIMVDEELKKLTPHQREVLRLYFVSDKTQYSIAEELGINQANVSRAKKRAVDQIKEGLGIKTLGEEIEL